MTDHADLAKIMGCRPEDVGQELDVAGRSLKIGVTLRLLPQRRVVLRALLDGTPVIAKIFSGNRRSLRQFYRERDVLLSLQESCIAAPRVLLDGMLDAAAVLVLEDLGAHTAGERLRECHDDDVASLVEDLVSFTSVMHESGFVQRDIHLDNFVYRDSRWHIIDAGGVSVESKPVRGASALRNLALLLSQFPPLLIPSPGALARCYRDESIQEGLPGAVARARTKRLEKYARKSLRSCTEYAPISTNGYAGMLRRTRSSFVHQLLDQDIDLFMQRGHPLKLGGGATVVQVGFLGESVVIKRYNIKSVLKSVAREIRSRARNSWINQAYLRLLFVKTPEAFSFFSSRNHGFLEKEYYLCGHLSGEMLPDICESGNNRERALRQLADFFLLMQVVGFSHGDSKYTNFIFRDGQLFVIDLDGMRRNVRYRLEQRLAAQRARLFEDWRGREELAKEARREFDTYFSEGLKKMAGWL